MTSTTTPVETDLQSAILNRIIDPDAPTLTPEAARSIMALGFGPADLKKMNQLAEANRRGKLKEEGSAELDTYLFVGRFLALIQAKARLSLRRNARTRS